jgi:hypothetical protein
MKNTGKIFRMIEKLAGQQIVCFHDESNNYAFKVLSDHPHGLRKAGEWHTINHDFLHGFL